MVLRVLHRLGGHGFAEVRVIGEAEHGDPLQPLLLQRLQELRPHEDEPLDQGVARVALLRRLQGPVEVVQDVDELQEQPLASLVEAALHVAGDALAEALILGADLAIGRQDLGQTVFREAGPSEELLGGPRPVPDGTRSRSLVRARRGEPAHRPACPQPWGPTRGRVSPGLTAGAD